MVLFYNSLRRCSPERAGSFCRLKSPRLTGGFLRYFFLATFVVAFLLLVRVGLIALVDFADLVEVAAFLVVILLETGDLVVA